MNDRLIRPETLSRVLHALVYVFLLLAAAKVTLFPLWPWWAVTIPVWWHGALAARNVLVFIAWAAASISDYRTAPRGLRRMNGGRP